jgi:hypothetical protein
VRAGVGHVDFKSPVSNRSIEIHDPQITFERSKLIINPTADFADSLQSTITMAEGVVLSTGSWERLGQDYMPTSTHQMTKACMTFAAETEANCYGQCRETPGCTAFQVAYTGAQQGRCCFFDSYTYYLGMTQPVIPAPGLTFSALRADDPGSKFAGLLGPDATLRGDLILFGFSPADLWANPKLQIALRRTLAKQATVPELTVTEDMVSVSPKVQQSGRRGISTDISYVITLTHAQFKAAPASAAALATTNSQTAQFSAVFQNEAAAIGAVADAILNFLTLSGTVSNIVQGTASFSFLVSDSTGPSVMAFQPGNGASGLDPNVEVHLTFSENVQAGTGHFEFSVQRLPTDHFPDGGEVKVWADVTSPNVRFYENNVWILPPSWLDPGTVTMTMPAGVVTDDPHAGTATPNAAGAISSGAYTFEVRQVEQPLGDSHAGFIQVGSFILTCHLNMPS